MACTIVSEISRTHYFLWSGSRFRSVPQSTNSNQVKGRRIASKQARNTDKLCPQWKLLRPKKPHRNVLVAHLTSFHYQGKGSPFLSNTTAISSLQPVHDLVYFYCLEELPVMNRGALCGDNQTHRIGNSPCPSCSIASWNEIHPCECTLFTLYIIREESRVQISGKSQREHNTHISLQMNKKSTSVRLWRTKESYC
jgi:hypothetical protein